jgi:membrane protease YdiL (CAAX protease family)
MTHARPEKRRVLVTALSLWSIAAFLQWHRPVAVLPARMAAPLAAALALVAALALYWATTRSISFGFLRPGRVPLGRVAPVALLLGLHGCAEEVLFRGYAFEGLMRWLGAPLAWLVTSLAFAAIHYPLQRTTGLLVHALTGATFGALLLLSGGLLAPALAHLTYNVLVVLERTRLPRESAAPLTSRVAEREEGDTYVQSTH